MPPYASGKLPLRKTALSKEHVQSDPNHGPIVRVEVDGMYVSTRTYTAGRRVGKGQEFDRGHLNRPELPEATALERIES